MDPGVFVPTARFKQKNPRIGVFRQASGQCAAGGTGTNNNVIKAVWRRHVSDNPSQINWAGE
jgi:hypothetical protein